MARTMAHPFARRQPGMTVAPASAAATGWVCPRCGAEPDGLDPIEAARAVRSFFVRFGVLFRHVDGDALGRCRPDPGSRSAVGHAEHVADDLAVLDDHLRVLIGDAPTGPAHTPTAVAPSDTQSTALEAGPVLAALTRTGTRLARTITGATNADWHRTATIGGLRPMELVQRTLHQASHHLHDAERGAHAAPAPILVRPVELATPGGRVSPPPPALANRQTAPGHDIQATSWLEHPPPAEDSSVRWMWPPEDRDNSQIGFARSAAMAAHPSARPSPPTGLSTTNRGATA